MLDQVKVDARLASIRPNEDVGRFLKAVPLLSKLTDAERAKLGGAVIEKNFENGARIIAQGEPGTGFFIIRRGNVAVQRADEQGNKQELATLKDGDFFGPLHIACLLVSRGLSSLALIASFVSCCCFQARLR